MKIRPIEAFLLENDMPVESGIFGKFPLFVPDGFVVFRITGENDDPIYGFLARVFPGSKTEIRPHENIIPEKFYLKKDTVQSGAHPPKPVCLLHAPDGAIRKLLKQGFDQGKIIMNRQMGAFRYEYAVCEMKSFTQDLMDMMDHMDSMVIADGHHRTAAYFALEPSKRDGLYSAIFALDEIRVHSYHRRLHIQDSLTESLVERFREYFDFYKASRDEVIEWSDRNGDDSQYIYLWHQGGWSRLVLRDGDFQIRSGSADMHRLVEEHVLNPFYVQTGQSLQEAVEYLSGPEWKGNDERIEGTILILFPPVSPTFLWESTARGELMPAKSTWIAPRMPDNVIQVYNPSQE